MKKILCTVLALLLAFSLFGCSKPQKGGDKNIVDIVNEKKANESEKTAPAKAGAKSDDTPVDVDLTAMSSTMVYAEVNHMVTAPADYMGKKVRMKGSFNYSEGNGKVYFACIISDATACCAQGIEFDLKEDRKFPDDYPDPGTEITVSGIFNTYNEGENRYCQLKDAVMES